MHLKKIIFLWIISFPFMAFSQENLGNTSNQSFNKAKKMLERKVYPKNRFTLYCNAVFTENKEVRQPSGFYATKHIKRASRVEWEHVVPAENFGRTFTEWREGNSECVDRKGKPFKGRKCAEKTNTEYRHMQSDMYNLYPAIGAVNALRSNYNFAMLPAESSDFGSCDMRIENKKAQPPERSRGAIARTYMYMDAVYPRYKMSNAQRKLMSAWDKQYPVSKWECQRAVSIEKIQGNVNPILSSRCI